MILKSFGSLSFTDSSAGAGIAELMTSTSSCVVSSAFLRRRRTIARAICERS